MIYNNNKNNKIVGDKHSQKSAGVGKNQGLKPIWTRVLPNLELILSSFTATATPEVNLGLPACVSQLNSWPRVTTGLILPALQQLLTPSVSRCLAPWHWLSLHLGLSFMAKTFFNPSFPHNLLYLQSPPPVLSKRPIAVLQYPSVINLPPSWPHIQQLRWFMAVALLFRLQRRRRAACRLGLISS